MRYIKRLLCVSALLLASMSAAALAAPANDIWGTSTGDYFLLMQDGANADGTYVTSSRQTTAFTAAQIFKVN